MIVINEDLLKDSSIKMPNNNGISIASYPELKLKKDQNSLYYYQILLEAKNKKEDSKCKGEDSLAGPKGNEKGTSGCKNLDAQLDSEEDIHMTWD